MRRGELTAQSRLLDRGDRDIGRQREINGLALEGLALGERLRQFHLATAAAPYVQHEGHAHLWREQAINRGARDDIVGERRVREPLPVRVEARADDRKQRAALDERIGLRDPNRRLRRREVGIALDPVLNQPIERL